jgi:hypothetical protein
MYCPKKAGGCTRIERNQNGQPFNPVFSVPEQKIEEDRHQDARDQNGCHTANGCANVV